MAARGHLPYGAGVLGASLPQQTLTACVLGAPPASLTAEPDTWRIAASWPRWSSSSTPPTRRRTSSTLPHQPAPAVLGLRLRVTAVPAGGAPVGAR